MKVGLFVAWVIALLAVAGSAAAEDRRDQQLADQIAASIRSYPRFTIFDDVSGHVEQGVVVLKGKVTMPFKKNDIERQVARIDGVREMRSEISVLPVSFHDDDLRRRIARAIYGSPSFWPYAAMVNPPIHIIVENGHVTLTGVVNSDVERALARSLATGLGEFSVVNQLRTER
jgi:hyperosmotically inducible protein